MREKLRINGCCWCWWDAVCSSVVSQTTWLMTQRWRGGAMVSMFVSIQRQNGFNFRLGQHNIVHHSSCEQAVHPHTPWFRHLPKGRQFCCIIVKILVQFVICFNITLVSTRWQLLIVHRLLIQILIPSCLYIRHNTFLTNNIDFNFQY